MKKDLKRKVGEVEEDDEQPKQQKKQQNVNGKLNNKKKSTKTTINEPEKKEKKLEEVKEDDESIFKKKRVLIAATRGSSSKNRHLMNDIVELIPHSKREQKLDDRNSLVQINDTCEMKGCNYAMVFDNRRDSDLYVWMAKTPLGPTIKFSVSNVHTLDELQMTGNCLKGSRPYLHFDTTFNNAPHLQLTRELLTQIFSTPKGHVKSKPFFDHVFSFFFQDGRVWFRNYQISDHEFKNERLLTEIGPRMILDINKIFSGGFGGQLLYNNPTFVSPRNQRRDRQLYVAYKSHKKHDGKIKAEERKAAAYVDASEIDTLFQ